MFFPSGALNWSIPLLVSADTYINSFLILFGAGYPGPWEDRRALNVSSAKPKHGRCRPIQSQARSSPCDGCMALEATAVYHYMGRWVKIIQMCEDVKAWEIGRPDLLGKEPWNASKWLNVPNVGYWHIDGVWPTHIPTAAVSDAWHTADLKGPWHCDGWGAQNPSPPSKDLMRFSGSYMNGF